MTVLKNGNLHVARCATFWPRISGAARQARGYSGGRRIALPQLLGYGTKDKFKIVQPRIDRASGPPLALKRPALAVYPD
jgi:hypothetical protein